MTGLLLFTASLVLLLLGFRVAFVFGATALAFAWLDSDIGLEVFELLPFRIYGIMQNFTLMALPLFIFMGLVLEKSGIAARLLSSIGELFGPVRGGLAVGVVLVGAVLAASTGIVGASVVMMAVISLPVMLRHGYAQPLASGTVAASGTLGQLIPPSIVLIILGDMMQISVGELFSAAIIPGVILVLLYLVYILGITYLKPELGPAIPTDKPLGLRLKEAGRWVLPVALLIFAVLGSIFAGIASPTESAAVGALGAIGLAWVYGGLNRGMIDYTATETVKISAMIFMILIGATAFSLVFNGGGFFCPGPWEPLALSGGQYADTVCPGLFPGFFRDLFCGSPDPGPGGIRTGYRSFVVWNPDRVESSDLVSYPAIWFFPLLSQRGGWG